MNHSDKDLQAKEAPPFDQPSENPGDPITTAIHSFDPEPIEVPERFVVDTAEKASWAVRKIVESRQYAARVRRWAEQELARSEREEQWLLRRFGAELESWLREELERRGDRRRSINLPGGTLGLRLAPPKLEVMDERCVTAWCRDRLADAVSVQLEAEGAAGVLLRCWCEEHALQVRLREHVLRDLVARHVADTGEIPAGAEMQPARDRFYVK